IVLNKHQTHDKYQIDCFMGWPHVQKCHDDSYAGENEHGFVGRRWMQVPIHAKSSHDDLKRNVKPVMTRFGVDCGHGHLPSRLRGEYALVYLASRLQSLLKPPEFNT